jgi:hypothetical protein
MRFDKMDISPKSEIIAKNILRREKILENFGF